MKKVIALLLTIIVGCSVMSGLAEEKKISMEEAFIVGFWVANVAGETGHIEFAPDMSAELTLGEKTTKGEWSMNQNELYLILDNGEKTYTLPYQTEISSFANDDNSVVFTRELSMKYNGPDEVKANDVSEFNGKWILNSVHYMDFSLDSDTLVATLIAGGNKSFLGKDDLVTTIDNGKVKMFYSDAETEFALVDGQLEQKVEGANEANVIWLTAEKSLVALIDGYLFIFDHYAK